MAAVDPARAGPAGGPLPPTMAERITLFRILSGTWLARVLRAQPQARGVLLDLQAALAQAPVIEAVPC